MDLFNQNTIDTSDTGDRPLAEVLRPDQLSGIVGQDHVIGPSTALGKRILGGNPPSMVVCGPPGTGKTSFARLVAGMVPQAKFYALNAVGAGVKDLREVGEKAHHDRVVFKNKTILFVDEIHRFNKAQQDVLLPYIESGDIVFIGATTENPSYELNRALLSRCQLVRFRALSEADLEKILKKCQVDSLPSITAASSTHVSAQAQSQGLIPAQSLTQFLTPEAVDYLLKVADGDARRLLNSAESLVDLLRRSPRPQVHPLGLEEIKEVLASPPIAYDKKSQLHFDMISAFIKSIRGSDADAALYWLVRMLDGGEDASYVARRLMILASEDIGNADPRALSVAVAAAQAVEMIGLPEAKINLAQAVTYLSACPKSNASYMALHRAESAVQQTGSQAVPFHLTAEGKAQYQYPHDFPKSWVDQKYLPDSVIRFLAKSGGLYLPIQRGFEKQIKEFLAWLKQGDSN